MIKLRGSVKHIDDNLVIIKGRAEGLEKYLDKDCVIEIREHREKRSLSANSYFHVIADQIRQHPDINRSMAYIKNWLLSSYGQAEYIDDEPVYYKTTAPPEYVSELEEIHMRLVKVDTPSPPYTKKAYIYRVYRGSHTYNVAEMQKLIDGTVAEAKLLGIQTETPESIRQMMERWGAEIERKTKKHNHE